MKVQECSKRMVIRYALEIMRNQGKFTTRLNRSPALPTDSVNEAVSAFVATADSMFSRRSAGSGFGSGFSSRFAKLRRHCSRRAGAKHGSGEIRDQ